MSLYPDYSAEAWHTFWQNEADCCSTAVWSVYDPSFYVLDQYLVHQHTTIKLPLNEVASETFVDSSCHMSKLYPATTAAFLRRSVATRRTRAGSGDVKMAHHPDVFVSASSATCHRPQNATALQNTPFPAAGCNIETSDPKRTRMHKNIVLKPNALKHRIQSQS